MNSFERYKSLRNSDSGCADSATMAEKELSAFFNAVTEMFGVDQARLSAEDWMREMSKIVSLPASPREWRTITARVASRLANRLTNLGAASIGASSLSRAAAAE
jgi:hypothetical protein